MMQTRRLRSLAQHALFAAALVLCTALRAQDVAPAVPEFIEFDAADLQTPAGADIAAAQDAFRESFGNDTERALAIAKEIVALTAEAYGDSHPHFASALTNLAIVQAENSNYPAAVENFEAAIRARERADRSIISAELINPLRGLANAFMALNEIETAIPLYERAIHISHVNEGPNNLDQVDVMDALSRAYFFLGEANKASDVQDNLWRLKQRRFADDTDQYLDALMQRARWFTRVQDYEQATQAYRRVERALSELYGSEDIRLVEPLIDLAFVAPRRDSSSGGPSQESIFDEGRRAIARAVRIARLYTDEEPELLPRTLIEQADWMMFAGLTRAARIPYREAWALLDANPEWHAARDDLFARPTPIIRAPMRDIYGRSGGAQLDRRTFPDRGFVDVRYDVNPLGRPINIEITRSDPPGLLDSHVYRQTRRSIYRPAFRDGEPVTYQSLSYRHRFRYSEQRLSNRERENIEEARAERADELEASLEEAPSDDSASAYERARVQIREDDNERAIGDMVDSAADDGADDDDEGDTETGAPASEAPAGDATPPADEASGQRPPEA